MSLELNTCRCAHTFGNVMTQQSDTVFGQNKKKTKLTLNNDHR